MLRRLLLALAVLASGLVGATGAQAAADARATGDVNLRAGPGTNYPRIFVVPRGAPVTVYGCLSNSSWCDVEAFGERGWLSSRYISIFYRNEVYRTQPRVVVPPVTFGFSYWDRWYADRPFYRDRDRWDRDRYDRDGWRDRDRDDWRDRDRERDRAAERREREREREREEARRERERERDRDRDRDDRRPGFACPPGASGCDRIRDDVPRFPNGLRCVPGSAGCDIY